MRLSVLLGLSLRHLRRLRLKVSWRNVGETGKGSCSAGAIYAKPSQGRRVRHATLRKPTSACTQNCEHGCATGHCNGADGSELDRVALAQIRHTSGGESPRRIEYQSIWLGCQRDGNTYERRGPAGRLPIWTHTRRPCASLARGRDTAWHRRRRQRWRSGRARRRHQS